MNDRFPLDIDRHWSAPGSPTYEEVAAKLLRLALRATSPTAREQFLFLAAMYQQLGTSSASLADTYLDEGAEPPATDSGLN